MAQFAVEHAHLGQKHDDLPFGVAIECCFFSRSIPSGKHTKSIRKHGPWPVR